MRPNPSLLLPAAGSVEPGATCSEWAMTDRFRQPLGTGADTWITHLRGTDGWDIPPVLTAGQGVLIYKVKAARPNVVVAPVPDTPNLVRFLPVHED